ncbi:predicted protein [Botrytis cinerea T4]|uniref:Uncharacterized protein n=1 Tax=Botryotinia fuckeliana (strain T4) TaxID=999810 RepID=G2YRW6_BOTF4|nr:predicted protein [Botrytis cinerea T4]
MSGGPRMRQEFCHPSAKHKSNLAGAAQLKAQKHLSIVVVVAMQPTGKH